MSHAIIIRCTLFASLKLLFIIILCSVFAVLWRIKYLYKVDLFDDDDVCLTSLFHACTGRTVAPLQLPISQSFQPHHQTSTYVVKY